jgi:ribosomal protein S12 methylthiotransferase accessory factor YcaO
MIDQFIESGHNLAEITVEGRKPYSVVSSLIKRIEARGLEIEVSTAGGCVY